MLANTEKVTRRPVDVTEEPTFHLRWSGGKLQQAWIVCRGGTLTTGPVSFEWRDIPTSNETTMMPRDY